MLSEFEKALVFREDLDATARRLQEQANKQRDERHAEIGKDLQFAKLIEYALLEPKTSGPYAIGKAYWRMFQRRHNPDGNQLAHLLLKAVDDDNIKGRGTGNNEPVEAHDTGRNIDGESEDSQAPVYEPVSEGTSRPGT